MPIKFLKSQNLVEIKGIIQSDYPNLIIDSIKVLGDGWDNLAIEINDTLIFRFPHNLDLQFETEIKVLDFLQGKITLEIPKVDYIGKKYRYMGYKKIDGSAMSKVVLKSLTEAEYSELVYDWANFLYELHSRFPIEKALDLGVEKRALNKNILNISIFDASIKSQAILDFISLTLEEFNLLDWKSEDEVFLHGDLHTENVAFNLDKKKLNGIFDFGDVLVGDISYDFHSLYKFNRKFVEKVVHKYERLSNRKLDLRKIALLSRMNEITDLAQFIDQPESNIYKKAIRRIKKWNIEIDVYK